MALGIFSFFQPVGLLGILTFRVGGLGGFRDIYLSGSNSLTMMAGSYVKVIGKRN